jgi:predicted CXXCH cytochrome family protein
MRASSRNKWFYLFFALCLAMIALAVSEEVTYATPLHQEETPTPVPVRDCKECHLDVTNLWSTSPHSHAFDDPVFKERWIALGEPGDCLLCHTTNFQQTTGDYSAEGVECEACHGKGIEDHPPAPVPIFADTDYCGICHTTTLGEWRLTGHAGSDVGCSDCHDPHSQVALFAEPDEMCINCHEEDMGEYLEDIHIQKGIGCIDCHALVIPPEEIPEDGIVPTGHSFTITPSTCVACHTDALHAGFSLPGYENGAAEAMNDILTESDTSSTTPEAVQTVTEDLPPDQRIEALEATLASRNISILFQGGVIGMAIGGTTAWIVARNLRRRQSMLEYNADD